MFRNASKFGQKIIHGYALPGPEKAFNTVDHQILLKELGLYDLSTNSIKWFENYLTNRFQMTKGNASLSDKVLVNCGIPQGSILGPLLFIIYINDIDKYSTECRVNLYVDDNVLHSSSDSYVELMLSFRIEVDNVSQWLYANNLTPNVNKTKYMIVASKNKLRYIQPVTLKMNNDGIEWVSEIKYLDENLTFEPHIKYVYSNVCQKLRAIRKTRTSLDPKTSVILYKRLVLPILDYCDVIYITVTLNE